MDFDDLDAEIDNRIAQGDIESLEALGTAKERRELKTFIPTTGITPTPRDHRLPIFQDSEAAMAEGNRTTYLRAFLFYGPGDTAEKYRALVSNLPGWVEMAVYEWPGHGTRHEEPFAADLEELAEDAWQAVKPAMLEVCAGAEMEGAPFVFIGHSVGCQILTAVAKKIALCYQMAPSLVIVADRAPLQFPLLSEAGRAGLDSDPDDVLRALCYEQFQFLDRKLWTNALRYACDVRDPFFHKFECDVMLVTADKSADIDKAAKTGNNKYMMATLRIDNTDEVVTIPVEKGTKVKVLKESISGIFAYRRDTAKVQVMNTSRLVLGDDGTVDENLLVTGLEDFKHPRYPWPHPVGIIGGGFQGIKTAMQWMIYRNENIVLFDRHSTAGGDAWHNAATKHSKIQTDFGAFNIWFGHEHTYTGDGGFGSIGTGGESNPRNKFAQPAEGTLGLTGAGTGVDFHPVRSQVLAAMQHACEEYGVQQYSKFDSDVTGLQVVGGEDAHDRYYRLTVKDLKSSGALSKQYSVSIVYHYPGAYDVNRIVDYPGEETFGGQIGYGMGHDNQGGKFVWDDGRMRGARAAILGNGAFSVENARSCCEWGASKVYLVTRRKSLACPRVPCWFCHQGPVPTPAHMLLDMFRPMYDAGNFGDPFSYYAVLSAGPENVTISQSSRFGIGDVTFLCHAYGLLEYRHDTLGRVSPATLHLKSGERLENIQHIIKALGLLGDPRVDKLHNLTHRIGSMLNGDWRRIVNADPTGMHAANFATFSAGPGACSFVKMWYYLHNHPWEMYEAISQGMLKLMPRHTISNTQPDQTVYMTNVQYEMAAGGIMGQYFPTLGRNSGDEGSYKYCLLHSMHPTGKFLEYCQADWDRYQRLFRENNGCTHEYIPYPYTKEVVQSFFDQYNTKFPFLTISWGGPPEEFKQHTLSAFQSDHQQIQLEMIPQLIRESKLHEHCSKDTDPWTSGLLGNVVPRRQKYLDSAADCALDFDPEQYEEWRNWTDSAYTFTKEGCGCKSQDIMTSAEFWGKAIRAMGQKSSRHNLPDQLQ